MSTLEGDASTIFCRCSNCGREIIQFRFGRNNPTGRFSSLYREAQLALRGIVGTRELDVFLADKDAVTSEF